MATDADTLRALTQAMHDSLMVVAPPGWTEATLEVDGPPNALSVASVSARGDGATAPQARAPLNIDPHDEAARLGEGLTELSQLLAQNGKQWSGGQVVVTRAEGMADWKLLHPDGSTLWFSRLGRDQLETMLFTDALFDLLRGTEKAFATLQAQLAAKLGVTTGHEYAEEQGLLTVTKEDGTRLRASAQLVGSYARQSFSWVWGWAVDELDPKCTERIRSVCAPDGAQPNLSALWRDHFHCDEGFAWALASHVAVSIGARGLYLGESPGQSVVVLYAVMETPAPSA